MHDSSDVSQAKPVLYDAIVIGGGPGGLVAALYLRRLSRRVLLIDGGASRAVRIPKIRNLVGYAEGISGATLLERLHQQYAKFGGEFCRGRARIKRGRGPARFQVTNPSGERQTYYSRALILATGMIDVEPPLPRERLESHTQAGRLGYCPICDAFDHQDQRIALLVRSRAVLAKLDFMSGFTRKLVVCAQESIALSARERRDLKRRNVEWHDGALVDLSCDGRELIISLDSGSHVRADAAYVMLGTEVPRAAVRGLTLKRGKDGFLIVNAQQETNVKGIYAVGDCVSGLSQISVAIGQAAIAATKLHAQLRAPE